MVLVALTASHDANGEQFGRSCSSAPNLYTRAWYRRAGAEKSAAGPCLPGADLRARVAGGVLHVRDRALIVVAVVPVARFLERVTLDVAPPPPPGLRTDRDAARTWADAIVSR